MGSYPQTVLVTGGAGFVGSHMAKRLLAEGCNVVIIDNFSSYYEPALKEARISNLLGDSSYQIYRCNIEDFEAVQHIFHEHTIDYVCHLAAQAGVRYSIERPLVYGSTNIIGTLNILELCRQHHVKGLVMASSSSVYGESDQYPLREDNMTSCPISLYAATKRSCELIAYTYHHLYGIPITCLRYFTVYGPWGRPDMAPFIFVKNIFDGKPIDVFGRGSMVRDFTYIDDIVEGTYRAIVKNLSWEIVNLGCGDPKPLNYFINLIERHAGLVFKKNLIDIQQGDVRKTHADISKARELFEWEPKVSLDEGLKKFVEWYQWFYLKKTPQ